MLMSCLIKKFSIKLAYIVQRCRTKMQYWFPCKLGFFPYFYISPDKNIEALSVCKSSFYYKLILIVPVCHTWLVIPSRKIITMKYFRTKKLLLHAKYNNNNIKIHFQPLLYKPANTTGQEQYSVILGRGKMMDERVASRFPSMFLNCHSVFSC